MEQLTLIDISLLLTMGGTIISIIIFGKQNKKDYKKDIEEAKEYKMKVDKALSNTDDNKQEIADVKILIEAIQKLTQKMGEILEDISNSRSRAIELEFLKSDGVELLLNHHKEESEEIAQFAQRFSDVKQRTLWASHQPKEL